MTAQPRSSGSRVERAFTYPFRAGWRARWPVLVGLVIGSPVAFPWLFGYMVAIVRSSKRDPNAGLPPWPPFGACAVDGLAVGTALAILTLPFAVAVPGLGSRLEPWVRGATHLAPDVAAMLAWQAAITLLALPWGILLLMVLPAAIAVLAERRRWTAVLDVGSVARTVRGDFAVWNVVVVAVVSAWGIGLAGLGLLLVGVVPGIVYAMLVSAHAIADLEVTPN